MICSNNSRWGNEKIKEENENLINKGDLSQFDSSGCGLTKGYLFTNYLLDIFRTYDWIKLGT